MTKFAEHFTNISVEAAKEQLQTADEFIRSSDMSILSTF